MQTTFANEIINKKCDFQIVNKAVYKALGNNITRQYVFPHLHLYIDDKVPKHIMGNISNQIRQLRPVPTRLDHISKEELENFPKIIKLPELYVMR